MRIEVRLHGTLAAHEPSPRAGEPFTIELPDGATVGDLASALRVPLGDIHLVFVNGRAAYDRGQALAAGDRVGIFPPVGGG